jgi:hypothetical protein
MDDQVQNARTLLRDNREDEDVERLTGLGLLQLIELRAEMAAAPRSKVGPGPGVTSRPRKDGR